MNKDVRYLAINAAVSLGTGFLSGILIAEQASFKIPAVLAALACVWVGIRDLKAAACLHQEAKK